VTTSLPSSTSGWRKSTFSGDGNCVELAALDDGRIAVRNSKLPEGEIVFFTRTEIDAFR
jgi:hypothetical protein